MPPLLTPIFVICLSRLPLFCESFSGKGRRFSGSDMNHRGAGRCSQGWVPSWALGEAGTGWHHWAGGWRACRKGVGHQRCGQRTTQMSRSFANILWSIWGKDNRHLWGTETGSLENSHTQDRYPRCLHLKTCFAPTYGTSVYHIGGCLQAFVDKWMV